MGSKEMKEQKSWERKLYAKNKNHKIFLSALLSTKMLVRRKKTTQRENILINGIANIFNLQTYFMDEQIREISSSKSEVHSLFELFLGDKPLNHEKQRGSSNVQIQNIDLSDQEDNINRVKKTTKETKFTKKRQTQLRNGEKPDGMIHIGESNEKQKEGDSEIKMKEREGRGICPKERKHIFKEEKVKKKAKKVAFPKFLVKVFKQYHQKVQCPAEIAEKNRLITEEFMKIHGNDYNLKRDMGKIVAFQKGECVDLQMNRRNRWMLRKIFLDQKKKLIIQNYLLEKNRFSYLLCQKIFVLRCSHPFLPLKNRYR